MNNPLFFKIAVDKTRGVDTAHGDFKNWDYDKGIPPVSVGTLKAVAGGHYKRWPDFMYCGSAVLSIVSDKVITDLRAANIKVEVGPVSLSCVDKPAILPPDYYYLCADNGIEIDEKNANPDRWWSPVKAETWNGADFCTAPTRPKLLFCSYRVLELAREKRWSNCQFRQPAQMVNGIYHPGQNIDYLAKKKDWPPEWLKPLLEQS